MSEPFKQGLRQLGYIEGHNFLLQRRVGSEHLYDLAHELVQLKPDVIVAHNAEPIRAAMSATKTIPIVMAYAGDPLFLRFVSSLEHPGGNVTGVSGLTLDLGGKWLELLKEAIPNAKRVAVFWHVEGDQFFPISKSLDVAARSMRIELDWLEVHTRAFSRYLGRYNASLAKADAFIVLPDLAVRLNEEISELGLKHRLPGMFHRTDYALEPIRGLMAYGANRLEQSRRAAYFVDKILKGARPAELPVEQPKSFELAVNLRTAKEIGVIFPPRVLAWADRIVK